MIDVQSAFPDIKYPVAITVPEGYQSIIKSIEIDGTPYEGDFYSNLSVQAGASVRLYLDSDNYNIQSLTHNGVAQYVFSYYQFTVTEATTISIDATKYETYSVGIQVSDPSQVHVYRGYYSSYGSNDEITLSAGVNTIELSQTKNYITVCVAKDCYFTQFTHNETDHTNDVDNGYGITISGIKDGDFITIATAQIERNDSFIYYLDQKLDLTSYDYYYFNVTRKDRTNLEPTLVEGYNVVPFCANDNPFNFGWDGYSVFFNLYKNGEKMAPRYENGMYTEFDVTPGDVIKAYPTRTPDTFTATFSVDAEAKDFTVTKDCIVAVDPAAGVTDLDGTLIEINGPVKVSVDGAEITAVDGKSSFTLTNNCTVTINNDPTSGVSMVGSDVAPKNIYNAQGMLLISGASQEQINALAPGFYIIGNTKTLIRK